MALQEADWLDELGRVHLPGMPAHLQRVLVCLVRGRSREEIAGSEGVSVHTVKDWIAKATEDIVSRLDEPHANHAELRGAWVFANLPCCLPEARKACK